MALTFEGSPHLTTVVIKVEGSDHFGTILTSYLKEVASPFFTEGSGSTIHRPENSCKATTSSV